MSSSSTANEPMTESVELSSQSDLQHLNAAELEDVPPNGGYGWVCVACVLIINANTWGVSSAYGVFLARYLADSTFSGATDLHYAIIGGLSVSIALFSSPAVATCNSKLGPRVSMVFGTVLLCCSLVASSFAKEIWHLFLSQGVCFGLGCGFLFLTASSVLPAWFSTKRSLAVGFASSGAGLGGLAYNLGAGAGVRSLGLRKTYQIIAISSGVSNLCAAVLLKGRKASRSRRRYMDLNEFKNAPVLLIIAWGILTELGYVVLLYSLPTFAESIGLSIQQGSIVGAVFNLGLALGRPVVGWISDRVGRINVATIMTALCSVLCLAVWIPAHSYAVLLLFALTAGTGAGTFWTCVAPVTAEVVGLQRMPAAFSVICLPLVIPTVFAEAIALQLKTSFGFLASQAFVGAAFLLAGATTWFLRAWKIEEIEQKAIRERLDISTPGARNASRRRWFYLQNLLVLKKV